MLAAHRPICRNLLDDYEISPRPSDSVVSASARNGTSGDSGDSGHLPRKMVVPKGAVARLPNWSSRWWFQVCFEFSPLFGEMIQFDEQYFGGTLGCFKVALTTVMLSHYIPLNRALTTNESLTEERNVLLTKVHGGPSRNTYVTVAHLSNEKRAPGCLGIHRG